MKSSVLVNNKKMEDITINVKQFVFNKIECYLFEFNFENISVDIVFDGVNSFGRENIVLLYGIDELSHTAADAEVHRFSGQINGAAILQFGFE